MNALPSGVIDRVDYCGRHGNSGQLAQRGLDFPQLIVIRNSTRAQPHRAYDASLYLSTRVY
jgi:hypothetical protein